MEDNFDLETKRETEDKTLQIETNDTQASNLLKPEHKKPKTKKILIIIGLVLFVLGIGGATLLLTKEKGGAPKDDQNQQTTTFTDQPSQQEKLFAVAYAYGDAEKAGIELFWRAVTGGDRTSAKNIGQNNYVQNSGTYKNKVFVITSPGNGSSSGASIWYSEDSGKTYEKIVSLELPKPNEMGDQITSAKFSKDGKQLVYGYLPSMGKGNTVRSYNFATKEAKDLFTIGNNGVFLVGYDSEKGRVYYFSGCFNCDGVVNNKLFEYDLNANTENVMYEQADKIGMAQALSSDYSKMLVLNGTPGDGLGGGEPYDLQEFDVANKTFKDLLPIELGKPMPQIGYRSSDNRPYFSDGNSVMVLLEDGTRTKIFEASKPIYKVLYLGSDNVVAASGTFENYMLTNYLISSNSTNEILSGDQSTSLFGVTLE